MFFKPLDRVVARNNSRASFSQFFIELPIIGIMLADFSEAISHPLNSVQCSDGIAFVIIWLPPNSAEKRALYQ
jgi:hypothetical protein